MATALLPVAQVAAASHGLDPALLLAIAHAESEGDPLAVSPSGARGLMQFMPRTAQSLGVEDPHHPEQAMAGAARYMRQLLDRFGGDEALAIAAYNAGPTRVSRAGGIPAIPETQNYVDRVQLRREALGQFLRDRLGELE
jgi:soluble lytic murein transglycosylase-like protein